MKFTIDGNIVDNSKSTKITIPEKKIISCNDYFYNKNNNTSVKTYCPAYYTEDYLWNYFEVKIDFNKFPFRFALVFYPYHSGSFSSSIIPYLATLNYELPNDLSHIFLNNYNPFSELINYFKVENTNTIPTAVLVITNSDKTFDLMINSPKFSGFSDSDTTWTGSLPKVAGQTNILTLGIGSKGNKTDGSFDPQSATLESTQFVFLNAEDDNLDHAFKIRDILSSSQSSGGSSVGIRNSHLYAWKFGIVNQTDNDLEVDIASYKKDISPIGEKLAKAVNGSLDGEAIEEIKPEYDTKQILPTTKEIVTGNSFKYNDMNIKLSGNGESFYYYHALIENTDESEYFRWARNIDTGTDLPSIFEIDLGKEIDNICQISFSPTVNYANRNSSCSVKNYSLYISTDHNNWSLIKDSIFDNTTHKLYFRGLLFSPEDIIIQSPIPIRYIKIIISSIYPDSEPGYSRSGFAHFRIYTNTKNLYNKEVDQSISNYKDNSFNQVTTKPEWDQKSKEDKIILNKKASFDGPPISKIKNELNDFRIITNHNNIPIYEKT